MTNFLEKIMGKNKMPHSSSRRSHYFVITLITGVSVIAGGYAAAQSGANHWGSYVNVRYRYVACYPKAILEPQGEAPDGDGEVFLSANGAKMLVYGSYNIDRISLKTSMAAMRRRLVAHGAMIGQQRFGQDYFTLTGTRDGSTFYEKRLLSGSAFSTLDLTIPAAESARFRPLIGHFLACFSNTVKP